ncbi:winged helix-turn-helix transcriptional regulator [Nocardia abscessus]|uniref:winged helix-turn-helix transcriptional regulator n=1 Tax=Nocardia abscessus TaxID=120957 RepID=UPI002457CED5|nr:helix-turn-helix domain-containing protein [Nocardia abscessus]
MKRSAGKSTCPMNMFLEVFGDPWTLLVLRDMLLVGKRRTTQFLDSAEAISTSVLADRLKRLEAAGMVRRVGTGDRNQVHYVPTGKAVDTLPVLFEMALWSMDHEPAAAPLQRVITRIREDPIDYIAEIRAEVECESIDLRP